jgi:hypothetical protein
MPKSLRKNSFLFKYKYWPLNSEQNSVFSYFPLFLFFEELLFNSLSALYIRNFCIMRYMRSKPPIQPHNWTFSKLDLKLTFEFVT